jgi:phosphonate transport system permease protein
MTGKNADPAEPAIRRIVDGDLARTRRRVLLALLLLAVIAASLVVTGVADPGRYRDALPILAAMIGDAWPPDFTRIGSWGMPVLETLAMGVAGTAIGVALALPAAALATPSLSPAPWLAVPLRALFNLLRSVPDLLMAAVVVAIVGFGTLPGTIALALHSFGMLGKFYAEIFEHLPAGPIDLLRSQRAGFLQIMRFVAIPEALPRLADVTLYRWEHNLRAAMMMGLVGAGGIGLELVAALKLFEYREALALLILTMGMVTLIDWAGMRIRARLRSAA